MRSERDMDKMNGGGKRESQNCCCLRSNCSANPEPLEPNRTNLSFTRSDNLDLQLSDYKSDTQEVSSGEFDARQVKKYATPKTLKHAL